MFWYWPLLIFVALWVVMTIFPTAAILLFATKIGFFTGYLLIASIVGLAIDAHFKRVHRVFLPISISIITVFTCIYYYRIYQEHASIRALEAQIRNENNNTIVKIRNYIEKHSLKPVPVATQYQQFSRYTLNHYYSPVHLQNDPSIQFSENFYLSEKYCRNIIQKDDYIDFKITNIKDGSTENGNMCYLRTKINKPLTMISQSEEKRDEGSWSEVGDEIVIWKRDILIDEKVLGSFFDASVHSLPFIPWPIVFCGNLGGFAPTPEHFCSISFRSVASRRLETRPQFATDASVSDVIAMILDLKPRDFSKFPEHELSPVTKKALSAYLASESVAELLDSQ